MGRATCIVTTELRAALYDIAARRGPKVLYILYDRVWGHERKGGPLLHYLDIISDKLKLPGQNGHVDVVLDEHGLRFGPHEDV